MDRFNEYRIMWVMELFQGKKYTEVETPYQQLELF